MDSSPLRYSSILALLVAGAAIGCGPGPQQRAPESGPADDLDQSMDETPEVEDMTPVRLETQVDDQTLEVGQSVELSAWAVNAAGDAIDTAQAVFNIDPEGVLEVESVTQSSGITIATLSAVGAGSAVVQASAEGLTSSELNFDVAAATGEIDCENPDEAEVVCDGLYYRCGPDDPWVEATEGACSPSTPENCSCGHFLEKVSGGGGYCVDEEPPYAYEPTCDCSYCVPDAGAS